YRREYDDRGRFIRQVPNDPQAAVVREAAERVYRGEPCHAIAADFNRRGIPAPRPGWAANKLRRLRDPGYAERLDVQVVQEALERLARGDSERRIAVDFNRREIPAPGGRWDLTQVK